ncbi:hypothetical protein BKA62DRAFT_615405 [Auriculariales sp. MPI-PUGE-AT-0066]|nr:hypothetical protein BKA62DRAFT_615405 [Auriculariales sp. MPI-PUGE-AT-0066]
MSQRHISSSPALSANATLDDKSHVDTAHSLRPTTSNAATTLVGEPATKKESSTNSVAAHDHRPDQLDALHQQPSQPVPHYALFADAPPPLDFSMKDNGRERTVLIWIMLLYLEAGVLPLLLFFSLRWGARLSNTTNLAIITSLVRRPVTASAVSGFKVSSRQWYLWLGKGHHTRRPIGAGRWGLDFLQFMLSLCMASFFIPLIIGSSVSPANPRIVAMSLPLTMIVLTGPMLLTGLFPHALKVPFRVSSLPSWQPLPPFAYFYVEDVVAVDGGGCTEFRQAWRVRYEESLPMRAHLRNISLMWGLGGCLLSGILLATAWVAPLDTAYGLCWSMPWLFIMVAGFHNVRLTHRMLIDERENWQTARGHVEKTLPFTEGKYDPPIVPIARVATFDPDVLRRLSTQHPLPPRANSDPESHHRMRRGAALV